MANHKIVEGEYFYRRCYEVFIHRIIAFIFIEPAGSAPVMVDLLDYIKDYDQYFDLSAAGGFGVRQAYNVDISHAELSSLYNLIIASRDDTSDVMHKRILFLQRLIINDFNYMAGLFAELRDRVAFIEKGKRIVSTVL